jgi:hypothetical protein
MERPGGNAGPFSWVFKARWAGDKTLDETANVIRAHSSADVALASVSSAPPSPHYAHLQKLMQPFGHLVSQKSMLHAVEVSTEAARTRRAAVTSRINLRFIFFPFRLR